MRVSIAQIEAGADTGANAVVARDAGRYAGERNADLLILPEYASAFDPQGVGVDLAQGPDGRYRAELRSIAREHALWIVAGVTSFAAAGQKAASEVVVVGPDGLDRATYRKVHLYDAFGHRESDRLVAGDPQDDPVVVQIAGVSVGVMACYDLRFPESARRLVDAGAEVIVVPAAWAPGPGKAEQWEILLRARAIENVAILIGVGLTGKGAIGASQVITPDGAVGLACGAQPQLRTIDIDTAAVAQMREANPSLRNRRFRVVPA
ncbi:nitrilase-related carbon-nitrogen hydrolase [Rarobacter incanus]|uniref:Putative amidohydrolase n=1 Tax=Rarobacter incanus TaxID=153494 RepID=A0A542SNT0_9MICO|nr:nitrilase-related carbon-nitrogen hydrolase [Rarobacter incanus]TQK76273.1 putative amidohydrolase [Rarobacter incanus]